MLSYNINLRKIGVMFLIFTLVFTGLGVSLGTSVSYAAASDVYVSSGGDDAGNGTKENPYATLSKASAEVNDGGTIYVLDDITVTPDPTNGTMTNFNSDKRVTITTAPEVQGTAVIKRGQPNSYINTLFGLTKGELTIRNIIIDGNFEDKEINGRLINVYSGSKLIIEEGAILQNSFSVHPGSAVHITTGSVVEMKGGEIRGNKRASVGAAVSVDAGAKFYMSGGLITDNVGGGVQSRNTNGGEVYLWGDAVITGNTNSAGKELNVNLENNKTLILNGVFTGEAGITTGSMTPGTQFGRVTEDGLDSIENLIADSGALLASYDDNNVLVWRQFKNELSYPSTDGEITGTTPTLKGVTEPNAKVTIEVVSAEDQSVVITEEVTADENGDWELAVSEAFEIGKYAVTVTASKNKTQSEPVNRPFEVGDGVYTTAPGGVGVKDGLISWVDVGKSANPENGQVTELQDLAINEIWDRNETDRIIPYSANAVNYNPAIQVTSSTTYFKKASVGTTQDTEREVFSVQASSNFGGFPWDLGGKYVSSAPSAYGDGSGNLIRTYFGSDSFKEIDVTGYDLKKTRVMNIWSAVDSGNPVKDQWSFSLDGKQLDPIPGTGDQHKVNFTLAAGSKVYIGAGHYSRFNGSISEVIVFNKKLSETERHKVNSYLALKYGLTLKDANGQLIDYVTSNHDAGQASTMWTAANNQGYGNRIAGIGRDDMGALYQKQSKSQDNGANVTISLGDTVANSNEENTEKFANDKSFFVFSDNGAGTEFINPIDKGNESLRHTARIYKVEKTNWADKDPVTGLPVQITLQVDKVETAEQWPLYLVVSADNQFDYQDKFYELVDGKATLGSEDFNNGSYFTIAAPAPQLISAKLDQAIAGSNQIVFTFDQDVVLTDSTGFSIEMDGTEVPIGQVSIKVDPVDTTKLIITLPSGTDIAGKKVTVSYSGNGNLKGTNGVPVDAFYKEITKLAKPNAQLNGEMLSWAPIDHADEYEVTVKLSDGTIFTTEAVNGTELDLSTLGLEAGSYDVTVTAKSNNDAYVDSEASDSVAYTVSTKVNKTELQNKINEAGTLDEEDYTPESWANLELELSEANNVLNDPNATQEQVDAAVIKLTEALDNLKKIKVDKTALEDKVNEAGTLDEEDYTPESWANLELELSEANNVLNDPNATQDQVDAAVIKLTEALDNLKKIKVDKTALEDKVNEAGTLDEEDYTPESWANLELELAKADGVLKNPNATQADVDQALTELQTALEDLVEMNGQLEEINLVGLTNNGNRVIGLTPPFNPNQNKNYYGTVTNDVYGIGLNPVLKYPDETQVIITVNNVEYPSDKWSKLPLNEGENEIRVGVYNTAGELINEYIFTIVRERASGNDNSGGGNNGGNSGTNNPSTPPTTPTPPTTDNTLKPGNIVTTVNGSNESFATGTVTPNGDQATVTIDKNKLSGILADGKGHKLGIRVPGDHGDVEVQGLTVEDLKKIADTGSSLDIEDVLAIYPVPAGQLDVNAISRQFGNAPISNIAANIKIKRSADDVTKLAREKATQGGYELLVHPVDLDLSFMHDGKTDRAGLLNGYASKYIALPEGIDPNRITTGVIINPNGTVFHVPTVVTQIDNRYFALINDLRSSGSYSVIWNPKDFDDVQHHWGRDDVNNVAARLSLKGNGDNTFSPNRQVTRSEFAEIIVLGLGLMRQDAPQNIFPDVPASAWYRDAVALADEFGIVRGYDNGDFKGGQQITREQGFAMIARAYRLIQSEEEPNQEQIASTLAPYADEANVAAWARADVAQLITAGIIQGNGPELLSPKAQMTRAEVTALIARMLKVTDLIDK